MNCFKIKNISRKLKILVTLTTSTFMSSFLIVNASEDNQNDINKETIKILSENKVNEKLLDT